MRTAVSTEGTAACGSATGLNLGSGPTLDFGVNAGSILGSGRVVISGANAGATPMAREASTISGEICTASCGSLFVTVSFTISSTICREFSVASIAAPFDAFVVRIGASRSVEVSPSKSDEPSTMRTSPAGFDQSKARGWRLCDALPPFVVMEPARSNTRTCSALPCFQHDLGSIWYRWGCCYRYRGRRCQNLYSFYSSLPCFRWAAACRRHFRHQRMRA
ncbi:hypothetical protein ACVWW4_001280 [Bradyrhizobium sp. LB7.1]